MLKNLRYKNWKKSVPSSIVEYAFSPAPLGLRCVNFIFQKIFRVNAGVKFMVHFTSVVSGDIRIGRNVAKYMANCGGCYIQGLNGVVIGDDTMIAPGVKIISANHDLANRDLHVKESPVHIGESCWLGANAIILPGVTLGNRVVVAAGSVVSKSFPDNVLVGGVPAKVMKTL